MAIMKTQLKVFLFSLLVLIPTFPSAPAHVTAMYDGTLSGSIVFLGCTQGAFSVSCDTAGVSILS